MKRLWIRVVADVEDNTNIADLMHQIKTTIQSQPELTEGVDVRRVEVDREKEVKQ